MISLRDIRVIFGNRPVLDTVDLDIEERQSTVILGRSGAGKSVLLKAILGLVPIRSGVIIIDGEDLATLGVRQRADLRSRISMLLQNGGLFDSMTVYENIAFPLRYHRTASGKDLDRRVREMASLVDLTDALEQEPFDLSGGMRRRAALARCLVQNPSYLFYDEPTTGLDPATSALVEMLIHRVATERKLTSVIVTHDLDLVRYLGDRIALLDGGSIVSCQGRLEALAPGSLIWESFITAREKIHLGKQI